MIYTYDEAATLLDVWHKVGSVCYVLSGEGVMWVWETCGWRKPSDEERAQYLSGLEQAKDRAPRLQQVYMPIVHGV